MDNKRKDKLSICKWLEARFYTLLDLRVAAILSIIYIGYLMIVVKRLDYPIGSIVTIYLAFQLNKMFVTKVSSEKACDKIGFMYTRISLALLTVNMNSNCILHKMKTLKKDEDKNIDDIKSLRIKTLDQVENTIDELIVAKQTLRSNTRLFMNLRDILFTRSYIYICLFKSFRNVNKIKKGMVRIIEEI